MLLKFDQRVGMPTPLSGAPSTLRGKAYDQERPGQVLSCPDAKDRKKKAYAEQCAGARVYLLLQETGTPRVRTSWILESD